jgi:hypothetical protein
VVNVLEVLKNFWSLIESNQFLSSLIVTFLTLFLVFLKTRKSSLLKNLDLTALVKFALNDYVFLLNDKIYSFDDVVIKHVDSLTKFEILKMKGGSFDVSKKTEQKNR